MPAGLSLSRRIRICVYVGVTIGERLIGGGRQHLFKEQDDDFDLEECGRDGVADGIRTRNNKLHKLGLYH
jgi:hypothetical protein